MLVDTQTCPWYRGSSSRLPLPLFPSPFSLSLSLSCHALLGLIPITTTSLQPSCIELFEALSAISRMSMMCTRLSPSLFLVLVYIFYSLVPKSGLLDRQLLAEGQICLCYSLARSITRCCTLISQCNPNAIRCLIDVAKKRVTLGKIWHAPCLTNWTLEHISITYLFYYIDLSLYLFLSYHFLGNLLLYNVRRNVFTF